MIVHLNGKLVPASHASISPFDRGFIFGEGVYEGLRSITWDRSPAGARVIAPRLHAQRMQKALNAAAIRFDASNLEELTLELLAANDLREAFIYWQVTSGTPSPNDPPRHRVPPTSITPTVLGYCSPLPALSSITAPMEKRVITARDPRWEMGWLKSTSLMGNVLVAKAAAKRGCDEAILIRGGDASGRGGLVAEGLATNVVLVLPVPYDGIEIVTPALSSAPMLRGVTRDILLNLAPEIRERPVHEIEVRTAMEVMLIGTSSLVTAVTSVDDTTVGSGKPGPMTIELFNRLVTCYREGKDQSY